MITSLFLQILLKNVYQSESTKFYILFLEKMWPLLLESLKYKKEFGWGNEG